MSALVRFFRRLSPTQLAAVTLVLSACAAAQEPDVPEDSGGTTPMTGGSAGAGGNSAGTAGHNTVIAGTGVVGTTGGMATGTGGKPAGTAGTTTTTGGTPGTAGATGAAGTAAGGTSASTCPQYAGALATDSLTFSGGFGTSTKGTPPWTGYGFTYKYGTAATITPGTGNNCFAAKKFCASGSVPAADDAGAGLGWNISQAVGAGTAGKVAIPATGVKFTLSGATAGMRVQLSQSATVSYCYTLTAADTASVTVPLASFMTECWGTTGTAATATTMIEAIQVVVPGAAAAAKTFDFCVVDIEPG